MNTLSTGLMSLAAGLALCASSLAQDTTIADPGGGAPLTDEQRAALEASMASDMSSVRVHSDGNARDAAGATGANAYAHGNDIYLGGGSTGSGNGLLAHELTHALQQQSSAAPQPHAGEAVPEDKTGRERDGRPRPRQERARPDQR
jgi:hypothetical protein